jgi:hypothetical protein
MLQCYAVVDVHTTIELLMFESRLLFRCQLEVAQEVGQQLFLGNVGSTVPCKQQHSSANAPHQLASSRIKVTSSYRECDRTWVCSMIFDALVRVVWSRSSMSLHSLASATTSSSTFSTSCCIVINKNINSATECQSCMCMSVPSCKSLLTYDLYSLESSKEIEVDLQMMSFDIGSKVPACSSIVGGIERSSDMTHRIHHSLLIHIHLQHSLQLAAQSGIHCCHCDNTVCCPTNTSRHH